MAIHPESLREVWDRCHGRLAVVARGFGEGAEDAAQEAFVELAKQPELPTDPMAWLVRVMRNRMLDRHRTEKRRKTREQTYAETRDSGWFGSGESADKKLMEAESSELLERCLKCLPMAQREVVLLHVWGEMSFKQIAEATHRSSSGCHRDYQGALQSIATALEKSGGKEANNKTTKASPTRTNLVI